MDDQIPKKLNEILQKANISTPHEIIATPDEVLKRLGILNNDISLLKAKAATYVGSEFMSVTKVCEVMKFKWRYISFRCASLDKLTRGGILTRGITEICGESGTGKTQILLQMSLRVQLPYSLGGLNQGAVYICTESQFPSKRLLQLEEIYKINYSILNIKYSENIFIEHILNMEDLVNCTCIRLPNLLACSNIGIIIIDSIAGTFRTEANLIERAKYMRKMGYKLHSLAESYGCAILCANQVASVVGSSSPEKTTPCLGLAWSNFVRTRLQLIRTSIHTSSLKQTIVRKMEVLYAPDLPRDSAKYLITSDGIVDILEASENP